MKRNLEKLLSPQSIAIIGASKTPNKVGAIVLRNIISSGFKGAVYPVNPNETEINGTKCYSTITELPEIVDLAVVAIPVAGVLMLLEEIGKKGIKNVVIFSAGFKEIGVEGKKLEEELIAIAKRYEISIIGPNCLGFANNEVPVNVTFSKLVNLKGNLRFISQSGALASSLFDWFETISLGFSEFVTLGNKAIIGENEILAYWLADESSNTLRPIGLYLESVSNGTEFVKLAKQITKHNPMILLKPGRSAAAAVAMKSHTGSIAGEDSVLETAAHEAGIIRCDELEDFFDLSMAFSWTVVPEGNRVAIISNAGGPAVLTTDAITKEGLTLASFDEETTHKLAECLPRTASFLNPVDILGDALADRFAQATEIVLEESTVDAVLVILTPQLMTQIKQTAEMVGALAQKYHKTLFCSFVGGGYTAEGERILNSYKIPTFRFPERAVKAMAEMYRWTLWKQQPVEGVTKQVARDYRGVDWSNPETAMQVAGIATPASALVSTLAEAKTFIKSEEYPVILKVFSRFILHKTEIGGVVGGIIDEQSLEKGWGRLAKIIDEIQPDYPEPIQSQIQKQIDKGVEVLVGIKRDDSFGAVLQVGAGGKLAELIMDRNLHLLPISTTEVTNLIKQSKVYTLLNGFRNGPVYDLKPLVRLIVALSQLFIDNPQLSDLEINPVLVTSEKAWALDPKVIIRT